MARIDSWCGRVGLPVVGFVEGAVGGMTGEQALSWLSGGGWMQEAVVLASEALGDGCDTRERRLSVQLNVRLVLSQVKKGSK